MFTVIIAEEKHLDAVNDYHAFLSPFIKDKDIALCRWFPEADSLADAVPELSATIKNKETWRAIIIDGDKKISQRNPFDASFLPVPEYPVMGKGGDSSDDIENLDHYLSRLDAYYDELKSVKNKMYKKASENPLTKLGVWLCEDPIVSDSLYPVSEEELNEMKFMKPHEYKEYLGLKHYRADALFKDTMRKEIRGKETAGFSLPSEIICVAERNLADEKAEIKNSWESHFEHEYSSFCDRNLYYDRMRFILFDILPSSHNSYTFDYIRFLYSVMLLAKFQAPVGSMSPNRVYNLECVNDEEALNKLVSDYDEKLASTQNVLNKKKRDILFSAKKKLSDKDVELLFCSNIQIPVSADSDFETSEMMVSTHKIGLSGDCPEPEEHAWHEQMGVSGRAFNRYMKLPRKAIHKAISDFRMNQTADLNLVGRLNKFQQEDVLEHTVDEELRLISTKVSDVFDSDYYESEIKEADNNTQKVMSKRMTRKTTVSLGIAVVLISLFGMVPALFYSTANTESRITLGAIVLVTLLLIVLIGIICLLCLRIPVIKAIKNYNRVIKNIISDVISSLETYSDYLSRAGNVMRGYSVINYLKETDDPKTVEEKIINKHILDLKIVREELKEAFGPYITGRIIDENEVGDYFEYDYSRPVDYTYPIIYSEDMKVQIDFLQTGNSVFIPVGFVKEIKLRREELYD